MSRFYFVVFAKLLLRIRPAATATYILLGGVTGAGIASRNMISAPLKIVFLIQTRFTSGRRYAETPPTDDRSIQTMTSTGGVVFLTRRTASEMHHRRNGRFAIRDITT
jgi:hypothetical protein